MYSEPSLGNNADSGQPCRPWHKMGVAAYTPHAQPVLILLSKVLLIQQNLTLGLLLSKILPLSTVLTFALFPSSNFLRVFISQSCYNILLQTGQLETAGGHSLAVSKTRSLKLVSLGQNQKTAEALGENPLLASSSFWQLLAFLGLSPHHSHLCLQPHIVSSSVCQISLCLFLRMLMIAFRTHSDHLG